VTLRLGPFKLPGLKRDPHKNDPYWEFFINTPPADLANTVTELIRNAPPGNVFPTKADIHTPEITSSHLKGMAQYFGADLVGIVRLPANNPSPSPLPQGGDGKIEAEYPFAVACVVRAEYDPRTAPGIGGQVPVQNGLFITFVLSAWIRELGFHAKVAPEISGEKLAAAAGLGEINRNGRLVIPRFGVDVHVADIILTDLPLAQDGSRSEP
jgi:hypothetical protein